MRPLSPRAAALVATLHARAALRERWLGRTDDRLAALAALRDEATPALVPELLPLVFGERGAVRDAAVALVARALAAATPDALLWLDPACRGAGWWPPDAQTGGWRGLTPTDVVQLDVPRADAVPVLGVVGFHPFGHVREAAVAQLDRVADPASAVAADGRELPFLLIRRNDWVDAVAARAAATLERRVTPGLATAWLAWLPLLRRLGAHTRRDAGALADRVLAMLRAPAQHPTLLARLTAGDRDTRRTCARLLAEADPTPATAAAFVSAALRDPDPVVRREAVTGARRHLAVDALTAMLPTALADPYPPMRRDALVAAAERLGERATPWLMAGLLDSGRSVREVAQAEVARRGVLTDVAGHYRGALAAATTPAHLAVAAAGVGETGRAADAPALLPLLAHERPAVRRAAARALGRLDAAGNGATLLRLLHDPSRAVTRAVRDALRMHAVRPDADALAHVLHGDAPTHGQLDALGLADALSKWDRLAVLLDALGSGEARVRDDARGRIAAWLARPNASFAQPAAAQLTALRGLLGRRASALPPTVASELGAVLDYWVR
ncbi:hypothetical protein tb265_11180 [Gemmatimonadetes bacterium T265]|nr:hypothetical protein tb265_11180 [Gemmatimonadetes bacterium T265]